MYVCTVCTHTQPLLCGPHILRTEGTLLKLNIDQFSNLEGIKSRILGYYGQGCKFFDREILDGIVAKPGGAHITRRCEHRQALQQSRQIFHVAPWVPDILVPSTSTVVVILWYTGYTWYPSTQQNR